MNEARKFLPTAHIVYPALRYVGLSPSEVDIYSIINGFLRSKVGFFFGSREYLADISGWSVRTVYRVLSRLLSLGLIERTADGEGRYGYKASEYSIRLLSEAEKGNFLPVLCEESKKSAESTASRSKKEDITRDSDIKGKAISEKSIITKEQISTSSVKEEIITEKIDLPTTNSALRIPNSEFPTDSAFRIPNSEFSIDSALRIPNSEISPNSALRISNSEFSTDSALRIPNSECSPDSEFSSPAAEINKGNKAVGGTKKAEFARIRARIAAKVKKAPTPPTPPKYTMHSYGKNGYISMTDEQYTALLSLADGELLGAYMSRLEKMLEENVRTGKAPPHSHYRTLRKWIESDCRA